MVAAVAVVVAAAAVVVDAIEFNLGGTIMNAPQFCFPVTRDDSPAWVTKPGKVYLVGAGPGDPDLLTVRAQRLLQHAQTVVYATLVSAAVLKEISPAAELHYAGKERNHHWLSQEGINELLVRLARDGKQVIRLKGGDPFIFGRGGEEMEALASAGVSFEVVPGITAACGVSSYAGIPLTHRDYAQTALFVTGHLKDGTSNLDWAALARPRQTVVIYMGLAALADICTELIGHGVSRDMPAAIVQHGTTRSRIVVTGSLASLPGQALAAQLQSPCLIIVGEVVKLHETLSWFEPERQHGSDARPRAGSMEAKGRAIEECVGSS